MEDRSIGCGELRIAGLFKALIDLRTLVLRGRLARDLRHFLGSADGAAHAIGPASIL